MAVLAGIAGNEKSLGEEETAEMRSMLEGLLRLELKGDEGLTVKRARDLLESADMGLSKVQLDFMEKKILADGDPEAQVDVVEFSSKAACLVTRMLR